MELKTIDLYDYCEMEKPNGATGILQCYIQRTSWELGIHRARPAVVILPGGGYASLAEREGEPLVFPFMKAGYQAFVLTYSYAPLRFPTSLRETAMAMRYIRENAMALEIDPDKVAVIGFPQEDTSAARWARCMMPPRWRILEQLNCCDPMPSAFAIR